MCRYSHSSRTPVMDTPATQLRKYLEMDCDYDATDNSCCLIIIIIIIIAFLSRLWSWLQRRWQVNKQTLNLLFEPALRALSVLCAGIERTGRTHNIMEELLCLLTVRGWLIRLWPQLFFWSAMLVVASPTAHFRKNKWGGANWLYVWCNWVNFHTLPNAYKIKQINNKANHLLQFEYTLLGSTSTCTWNSVLVLVNFASTCTCTCTCHLSTCTCTCTLCTCDITGYFSGPVKHNIMITPKPA